MRVYRGRRPSWFTLLPNNFSAEPLYALGLSFLFVLVCISDPERWLLIAWSWCWSCRSLLKKTFAAWDPVEIMGFNRCKIACHLIDISAQELCASGCHSCFVFALHCGAGLFFLEQGSLCGQEAFAAMYLVELLRAIRILQANPFKVSVVSFRKPLRHHKESFCSYYRVSAFVS